MEECEVGGDWTISKPVKRARISECIIHGTDSTEAPRKPALLESWKQLFLAAAELQHGDILEIPRQITDDKIENVFYHDRCRSTFLLRVARQNRPITSKEVPQIQSIKIMHHLWKMSIRV